MDHRCFIIGAGESPNRIHRTPQSNDDKFCLLWVVLPQHVKTVISLQSVAEITGYVPSYKFFIIIRFFWRGPGSPDSRDPRSSFLRLKHDSIVNRALIKSR